MLSERMLSTVVRACSNQYLKLTPTDDAKVVPPKPGQRYMLYMHVPFCERLCPYCSFNRFPFKEERAKPYFANMRKEMMMLKDLGYDFESVYIGGGTPTIMIDELCETIDMVLQYQNLRVQTGVLNEILTEAMAMQQPPSDRGKRLKIYYMTQVSVKPPTFVIFVNDKELMHFSYVRYLENKIRESFGFRGTPLKFIIRERKEKEQ